MTARALRAGALVAACFVTAILLAALGERAASGLPQMPWSAR